MAVVSGGLSAVCDNSRGFVPSFILGGLFMPSSSVSAGYALIGNIIPQYVVSVGVIAVAIMALAAAVYGFKWLLSMVV